MTEREAIAAYLDGVAEEATDRPRALAAAVLARALRRAPGEEPAALSYVEGEVVREAAGDDEVAAEMVYEIGSILVELRERFPDAELCFPGRAGRLVGWPPTIPDREASELCGGLWNL